MSYTPSNIQTGLDNFTFNLNVDTQRRLDEFESNINKPVPLAIEPISTGIEFDYNFNEPKVMNGKNIYEAAFSDDLSERDIARATIRKMHENDPAIQTGSGMTINTPYKQAEKYLDKEYGFNPMREDQEDFYYRNVYANNSFAYNLGANALRFTTRTLAGAALKFTEGLGYVGAAVNPFNWFSGEFVTRVADNAFSKAITEGEEAFKNLDGLAVYRSIDYDKKGFFNKLGDATFWNEDISDGLSFMLSAAIPAGGLGLIGRAGKLGKLGTVGRVLGTEISTATKAGKIGSKIVGHLTGSDNVAGILSYAYNTVAESASEANETFKTSMSELKDLRDTGDPRYVNKSDEELRKIAGGKAAFTFKNNLVLLALTNGFENRMYSSMFNYKFGDVGKYITGIGSTEAKKLTYKGFLSFYRDIDPLSRGVVYGKKIGEAILKEGFVEENFQLAISRLAQGHYESKSSNDDISSRHNILTPTDGVFGTFVDILAQGAKQAMTTNPFSDTYGSDIEAATSIGLGGVIGIFGNVGFSKLTGERKNLVQRRDFFIKNLNKIASEIQSQAIDFMGVKSLYLVDANKELILDNDGNPQIDPIKFAAKLATIEDQTQKNEYTNFANNPINARLNIKQVLSEYINGVMIAGKEKEFIKNLDEQGILLDASKIGDFQEMKNYALETIEIFKDLQKLNLYDYKQLGAPDMALDKFEIVSENLKSTLLKYRTFKYSVQNEIDRIKNKYSFDTNKLNSLVYEKYFLSQKLKKIDDELSSITTDEEKNKSSYKLNTLTSEDLKNRIKSIDQEIDEEKKLLDVDQNDPLVSMESEGITSYLFKSESDRTSESVYADYLSDVISKEALQSNITLYDILEDNYLYKKNGINLFDEQTALNLETAIKEAEAEAKKQEINTPETPETNTAQTQSQAEVEAERKKQEREAKINDVDFINDLKTKLSKKGIDDSILYIASNDEIVNLAIKEKIIDNDLNEITQFTFDEQIQNIDLFPSDSLVSDILFNIEPYNNLYTENLQTYIADKFSLLSPTIKLYTPEVLTYYVLYHTNININALKLNQISLNNIRFIISQLKQFENVDTANTQLLDNIKEDIKDLTLIQYVNEKLLEDLSALPLTEQLNATQTLLATLSEFSTNQNILNILGTSYNEINSRLEQQKQKIEDEIKKEEEKKEAEKEEEGIPENVTLEEFEELSALARNNAEEFPKVMDQIIAETYPNFYKKLYNMVSTLIENVSQTTTTDEQVAQLNEEFNKAMDQLKSQYVIVEEEKQEVDLNSKVINQAAIVIDELNNPTDNSKSDSTIDTLEVVLETSVEEDTEKQIDTYVDPVTKKKAKGNYIDLLVDKLRASGFITIVTKQLSDLFKNDEGEYELLNREGVKRRHNALNRIADDVKKGVVSYKMKVIQNKKEYIELLFKDELKQLEEKKGTPLTRKEKDEFIDEFYKDNNFSSSERGNSKMWNIGILIDAVTEQPVLFEEDGTDSLTGKPIYFPINFSDYLSTKGELSYRAGKDSEKTGSKFYKLFINFLKLKFNKKTGEELFSDSQNEYIKAQDYLRNSPQGAIFAVNRFTNGSLNKTTEFRLLHNISTSYTVKLDNSRVGKIQPLITVEGTKKIAGAFAMFKNLEKFYYNENVVNLVDDSRNKLSIESIVTKVVNEGVQEGSLEHTLMKELINGGIFQEVKLEASSTAKTKLGEVAKARFTYFSKKAVLELDENSPNFLEQLKARTIQEILNSRVSPRQSINEKQLPFIVGSSVLGQSKVLFGVDRRAIISSTSDEMRRAPIVEDVKEDESGTPEGTPPSSSKDKTQILSIKPIAIELGTSGLEKQTARTTITVTKDDIERRRQEELKGEAYRTITKSELYQDEEGRYFKVQNLANGEIKIIISSENGKSEGVVGNWDSSVPLDKLILNPTKVRDLEFTNKILDKINAKYDAKLAELENDEKTTAITIPYKKVENTTIKTLFIATKLAKTLVGEESEFKNEQTLQSALSTLYDKNSLFNSEKTAPKDNPNVAIMFGNMVDAAFRLDGIDYSKEFEDYNDSTIKEGIKNKFVQQIIELTGSIEKQNKITGDITTVNNVDEYFFSKQESIRNTPNEEDKTKIKIETYKEIYNAVKQIISEYQSEGYTIHALNPYSNKTSNKKNFFLYNTELSVMGEPDLIAIPTDESKPIIILDSKARTSKKELDSFKKAEERMQMSFYAHSLEESSNNKLRNATKVQVIRTRYNPNLSGVSKISSIREELNDPYSIEEMKALGLDILIQEVNKKISESNEKVAPTKLSDTSKKGNSKASRPIQDDGNLFELPSLLSVKERLSTEEEINEQVEYAGERIKGVDVRKVTSILNSPIGARFIKRGLDFHIEIFDKSNYGAGYHETFHAYSQLYLTKEEKIKLYKSVQAMDLTWKNRKGQSIYSKTASFLEIEEFLAEQFKYFVISKKENTKYKFNDEIEIPTDTKNIFEKIWELIKSLYNWFTGTNTYSVKAINDLFEGLHNNTFSQTTFSEDNVMFDELFSDFVFNTPTGGGIGVPATITSVMTNHIDNTILKTLHDNGFLSIKLATNKNNKSFDLKNLIKQSLIKLMINKINYNKIEVENVAKVFYNTKEIGDKQLNNSPEDILANRDNYEILDDFLDYYVVYSNIQSLKKNYYTYSSVKKIANRFLESLTLEIEENQKGKPEGHNNSGNEVPVEDMTLTFVQDLFSSIPRIKQDMYNEQSLLNVIDEISAATTTTEIASLINKISSQNELDALMRDSSLNPQLIDFKFALEKLKMQINSTTSFWDDSPNSFKTKLKSADTLKNFPEAVYIYYYISKIMDRFNAVETSLLNKKDQNPNYSGLIEQNDEFVADPEYVDYTFYLQFLTNMDRLFGLAKVPYLKFSQSEVIDDFGVIKKRNTLFPNLSQDQIKNIDTIKSSFKQKRVSDRERKDPFETLYNIIKNDSLVNIDIIAAEISSKFRLSNDNLFQDPVTNTFYFNPYYDFFNKEGNNYSIINFFTDVLNIEQLSLITPESQSEDFKKLQTVLDAIKNEMFNFTQKSNVVKSSLNYRIEDLRRFKNKYETYLNETNKSTKQVLRQEISESPEFASLMRTILEINPVDQLIKDTETISENIETSKVIPQLITLSNLMQKYQPKHASSAIIQGEAKDYQTENQYHRRSITMLMADLINEVLVNDASGNINMSLFDNTEELKHLDPRKNPVLYEADPYLKILFTYDKQTKTLHRVTLKDLQPATIESKANTPAYRITYAKLSQLDTRKGNEDLKTILAKDIPNELKVGLEIEMMYTFNIKPIRRPETSNSELMLGIEKTGDSTTFNGKYFERLSKNIAGAIYDVPDNANISDDALAFLKNSDIYQDGVVNGELESFMDNQFINDLQGLLKYQMYNYYHHLKYTSDVKGNLKGRHSIGMFSDVSNTTLKAIEAIVESYFQSGNNVKNAKNFEEFFEKAINDSSFAEAFYVRFPIAMAEHFTEQRRLVLKENYKGEPFIQDKKTKDKTQILTKVLKEDALHAFAEANLFFGSYVDFKDALKRKKLHINQGDSILSGNVFLQNKLETLNKIASIGEVFAGKPISTKNVSYILVEEPKGKSEEVLAFEGKYKPIGEVKKAIKEGTLQEKAFEQYKDLIVEYVKDKKNYMFHMSSLVLAQQIDPTIKEISDEFAYDFFLKSWSNFDGYYDMELANGSTPFYNLDYHRALSFYANTWSFDYELQFQRERLLAKMIAEEISPNDLSKAEKKLLQSTFAGFNNAKNALTGNTLSKSEDEVVYNPTFHKTAMAVSSIDQFLANGTFFEYINTMKYMYKKGLTYITFPTASKGFTSNQVKSVTEIELKNEKILEDFVQYAASGFFKNQVVTDKESKDVTLAIQLRSFLYLPLANAKTEEERNFVKSSIDAVKNALKDLLASKAKDSLYEMGLGYNDSNTEIIIKNEERFLRFIKDKFKDEDDVHIVSLSKIKNIGGKSLDLMISDYQGVALTIIAGIADDIFREVRLPGVKGIMTPELYRSYKKDETGLLKTHKIKTKDGKEYVSAVECKLSWKEEFRNLQYLYIKDKETGKYIQVKDKQLKSGEGSNYKNKPVWAVMNDLMKSGAKFYAQDPLNPSKYSKVNISDILKGVGIRIPLQNVNFIGHLEIVEFLDPARLDAIILPAEFYIKVGGDNDADTVPSFFKIISSNGSSYVSSENRKSYDSLINELIELNQKIKARRAEIISELDEQYNTNIDENKSEDLYSEIEDEFIKNDFQIKLMFEYYPNQEKLKEFLGDDLYDEYIDKVTITKAERAKYTKFLMRNSEFQKLVQDFFEEFANYQLESSRGSIKKDAFKKDEQLKALQKQQFRIKYEKQNYKDGLLNLIIDRITDVLELKSNYPLLVKTDSVDAIQFSLVKNIADAEGLSYEQVFKERFDETITPINQHSFKTNADVLYVNQQRTNLGSYISMVKALVLLSANNLFLNNQYKKPNAKKKKKATLDQNEDLKSVRQFKFPFLKEKVKHFKFSITNEDGAYVTDLISQITSTHIDVYKKLKLLINLGFNYSNKNTALLMMFTGHSFDTVQQFLRFPIIQDFHQKMTNNVDRNKKYKHLVAEFFYKNNPTFFKEMFSLGNNTKTGLELNQLYDGIESQNFRVTFSDNINKETQIKIHALVKPEDITRERIVELNQYFNEELRKGNNFQSIYNRLSDKSYTAISEEKKLQYKKLTEFLLMYSLELNVTSKDFFNSIAPIMNRESEALTNINVKEDDEINTNKLLELGILVSPSDKNSDQMNEASGKLNDTFLGIFENKNIVNSFLTITLPKLIRDYGQSLYQQISIDVLSHEQKKRLHNEILQAFSSFINVNFFRFEENNELDELIGSVLNRKSDKLQYNFFKDKTLYLAFFHDVNLAFTKTGTLQQINALVNSDVEKNNFKKEFLNKMGDEFDMETAEGNQMFEKAWNEEMAVRAQNIISTLTDNMFTAFETFKAKYSNMFKYVQFVNELNVSRTSNRYISDNAFFSVENETKFDVDNKYETEADNVLPANTSFIGKRYISSQVGIKYEPQGDVRDRNVSRNRAITLWEMFVNMSPNTASIEHLIDQLGVTSSEDIENIQRLFYKSDGSLNITNINEVKAMFTLLAYYACAQSGMHLNKQNMLIGIAPQSIKSKVANTAFSEFEKMQSNPTAKEYIEKEFIKKFKMSRSFEFFSDTISEDKTLTDDQILDLRDYLENEEDYTDEQLKFVSESRVRVKNNSLSLAYYSILPGTLDSNIKVEEIIKQLFNTNKQKEIIKKLYGDKNAQKTINFTIQPQIDDNDNSITDVSC